jgi:hypothetical protein
MLFLGPEQKDKKMGHTITYVVSTIAAVLGILGVIFQNGIVDTLFSGDRETAGLYF